MAEVVETSVVWVQGVAEGDFGEFEAVQVGFAVAPAHEEVEEVSMDVTLKAARGEGVVVWKAAGPKLGFGEEGVAHPTKVKVVRGILDFSAGGASAREEEGWEGDEEVLVGEVDADGDGAGVPNGEGRGARGDTKADMSVEGGVDLGGVTGVGGGVYGGHISTLDALGWSAMVQGVSKSVGALSSVRTGVLGAQGGKLTRAMSVAARSMSERGLIDRRWRTRLASSMSTQMRSRRRMPMGCPGANTLCLQAS